MNDLKTHDRKHGILSLLIDVVACTPTLETEDITMAARESRDKKEVTRFAPEKAVEKKEPKDLLYEGSGTKLGDITVVPINLGKIDSDHDLLKAFHNYLYGVVGKKSFRKKNIRSFSGFPEEKTDESREARTKKFMDNKKWTNAALKDLCTFLGLEKAGDKAEVVERIVSFLFSPDNEASKAPAPKKRASSVKTKSKEKTSKRAKKVKREVKPRPLSGYMVFCRTQRVKLKAKEPGLDFKEMGAKLGEMWASFGDVQKEEYKEQGIEEFEKAQEKETRAGAAEHDAGDEEEGEGEDDVDGRRHDDDEEDEDDNGDEEE